MNNGQSFLKSEMVETAQLIDDDINELFRMDFPSNEGMNRRLND